MILLDTKTIIHYVKGDAEVARRLQPICHRELTALHHVPFDYASAQVAAKMRIDLECRGLTIGPMDLLIAGIAVSRAALLITNNTKEFGRVKNLRIADWTQP